MYTAALQGECECASCRVHRNVCFPQLSREKTMGKEQEFTAKVLKCANKCARHEWNKEVELFSLRGREGCI